MANSATNDKTVNKVALCSAIFAGFAYVGYSVVRTAFCRKLGRRDGDGYPEEHRIYFRRLSQTTQTDVLLGNLDLTDNGKVVLRPLTVQDRIRELNLKARMFTDTMLAIQATSGPSPRHSAMPGPRSLQVAEAQEEEPLKNEVPDKSVRNGSCSGAGGTAGSPTDSGGHNVPSTVVDIPSVGGCSSTSGSEICSPWGSPRILSPVDVRHILSSRSSENLVMLGLGSPAPSPVKRRWTRRSLRRQRSPSAQNAHRATQQEEAEKLLRDTEDELRLRLDAINRRQRVMAASEAKSLVALLHSNDEVLLERTLITIANCGTFAGNQDMLREAGCLFRLSKLLTYPKPKVQLAAIKALGNLALNEDNQKELKDAIPVLLSFVNKEQPLEKLVLCALVTLTNIAVLPEWHDEFYPVLHNLYHLVDSASPQIKLQALKLLINLSCNEDMVPSLLAAQAPRRLIHLLDMTTNEDILLRVVTLLANLTKTARELNLDPAVDLPAEDKAASPDTMYAAIFGVNIQEKIRSKIFVLMNQHPNEDIRVQARKMYESLKS